MRAAVALALLAWAAVSAAETAQPNPDPSLNGADAVVLTLQMSYFDVELETLDAVQRSTEQLYTATTGETAVVDVVLGFDPVRQSNRLGTSLYSTAGTTFRVAVVQSDGTQVSLQALLAATVNSMSLEEMAEIYRPAVLIGFEELRAPTDDPGTAEPDGGGRILEWVALGSFGLAFVLVAAAVVTRCMVRRHHKKLSHEMRAAAMAKFDPRSVSSVTHRPFSRAEPDSRRLSRRRSSAVAPLDAYMHQLPTSLAGPASLMAPAVAGLRPGPASPPPGPRFPELPSLSLQDSRRHDEATHRALESTSTLIGGAAQALPPLRLADPGTASLRSMGSARPPPPQPLSPAHRASVLQVERMLTGESKLDARGGAYF